MVDRRGRTTGRKVFGLALTLVVVLVLSACSIGGDDEDDAGTTATSEPVVETTQAVQDTGTSLPPIASERSTPASSDATAAGTAEGGASPSSRIVVSAPPIDMPTMTPTAQLAASTPAAQGATPQAVITSDATRGDGTGGAGASVSGAADATQVPVEGSPFASPASDVAVATGCDVTDVPPYTGEAAEQVTTSDAIFRAGPGQDCDEIGEPIAAGVTVEVLSEPIQRANDDEFQWVLVSIDGTQGWLATALLEPAAA